MRNPITLLLLGLFLLCAFTSYQASATLVYDSDGNPLINGGVYYMVQAIFFSGGGLQYVETGNETCPLSVVNCASGFNKGYPLNITSSDSPLLSKINEEDPVNIAFTDPPPCGLTPSEWTVVKGLPEGTAVKLNGYPNIALGSFKIKKSYSNIGYNIEFCSIEIVDHYYTEVCEYVNLDSKGNRSLVLTDDKYSAVWFNFKKVSTVSAVL